MGQNSRSGSDGHGNRVNSIAAEPLKASEQKLTQILTIVGRQSGWVFKVMGS